MKERLGSITDLNLKAVETDKSLGSILSDVRGVKIDNLITRLHYTAGMAFKASTEIRNLTEAIGNYNLAVGAARNLKLARIDESGESHMYEKRGAKKSAVEKRLEDWFFDRSAFFMLRYRMYSQILDGIFYSLADVVMGRSRAKLADALGELTAVAFTSSQRKQAEFAANVFSMKLWNVTAEECLNAMSSTASAFDVNRVGFDNIRRMNEAAIRFGKLSKLSAEKSADLMTGIVLQLMTRFPEDVSELLKSGHAARVKDYGVVDLGGLTEKIAAQSAKAIQISTVWGPGIAGAFKYMLPELLEKGWNIPAALSLLGSIKDAGFPAEQIGRATKETFLSAPADFARTILWATDRWEAAGDDMTKAEAKSLNEEKVRILTKTIQKWFSDPELFQKNMPILGEALRLAEKKGALPVEDLGLSKYFMSVTRTLTTEGSMSRFKEQMELINKADYDEVASMAAEMLDDAGTAWARISNSFSRFFQTMADSPLSHSIADPISVSLDFLSAYSALPRMLQARGLKYEEAIQAFEKEYQKPFEAMFGEYLTRELREGIGKAYGEVWDIMIMPEYFALGFNFQNKLLKQSLAGIKKALPWNWGRDDSETGFIPLMPNTSKMLEKLINPFEFDWDVPGKFLYAIVEDMYGSVQSTISKVWKLMNETYEMGAWVLGKLGWLFEKLADFLFWPAQVAYKMFYPDASEKPGSLASTSLPQLDQLTDPEVEAYESNVAFLEWIKGIWKNEPIAPATMQGPISDEGMAGAKTEEMSRLAPDEPKDDYYEETTLLNRRLRGAGMDQYSIMPQQVPAASQVPVFLQNYSVPSGPRDESPIQIENRLIIDGRELAHIISEIIQRNRITNYQAFGADPFGYNTAI